MSKHPLEIILGSKSRHKILRFLYRNNDKAYGAAEIADRTQEDISTVRKELKSFIEAGLIIEKRYKSLKDVPTIKSAEA